MVRAEVPSTDEARWSPRDHIKSSTPDQSGDKTCMKVLCAMSQ